MPYSAGNVNTSYVHENALSCKRLLCWVDSDAMIEERLFAEFDIFYSAREAVVFYF